MKNLILIIVFFFSFQVNAQEEGILNLRCEFNGISIDESREVDPYNIDLSINFDEMNWTAQLPRKKTNYTYDISKEDIGLAEFKLHSYFWDNLENRNVRGEQVIIDRTNGEAIHNYFQTAFFGCGESENTICKYPRSDLNPKGQYYSFKGECIKLETIF